MKSAKILGLAMVIIFGTAGSLQAQAPGRAPQPAPQAVAAVPDFLPLVAKGMTSGKQGPRARKAQVREIARAHAQAQRQQSGAAPRR